MNLSDIQKVKQQFGIIGNDPELLRAIDTAIQVAQTDLSVLITGESGVGKEFFPKIIHANTFLLYMFCSSEREYRYFPIATADGRRARSLDYAFSLP